MKRKNIKLSDKPKPNKGIKNPTPLVKQYRGPVLKTFDSVRKYLNKIIRKLEAEELEPKIANSIVLACNLILSCIKHEIENEELMGRISKLEETFKQLQQQSKSPKGLDFPIIDLPEKKPGKDFLN